MQLELTDEETLALLCTIVVSKEAQGPDHGLNTLGNPGNVGLDSSV
jgi:hypothetical protein